jgi:hypothetical protein
MLATVQVTHPNRVFERHRIADAREVFVIDVEDRPAALGELVRRLAEANVNVDLAYTTFTGGKIVIATDDVGSARSALRA